MKVKIPTLLFLSFCLVGLVSPASAEQGWITYAKVKRLVVVASGGINVRLEPELTSCTSQSGYGVRYASVYPDHPALGKIYSTFLAAYMADKPVAIYLSDSTCKVVEVELGGRQ